MTRPSTSSSAPRCERRTRPTCSPAASSTVKRGDQAWRFVREHWEHANAAFPNASIVRMVDPVKTLTARATGRRGGLLRRARDPQAAKTLQQVLERQRVNVSLRERATPTLAARFGA